MDKRIAIIGSRALVFIGRFVECVEQHRGKSEFAVLAEHHVSLQSLSNQSQMPINNVDHLRSTNKRYRNAVKRTIHK